MKNRREMKAYKALRKQQLERWQANQLDGKGYYEPPKGFQEAHIVNMIPLDERGTPYDSDREGYCQEIDLDQWLDLLNTTKRKGEIDVMCFCYDTCTYRCTYDIRTMTCIHYVCIHEPD